MHMIRPFLSFYKTKHNKTIRIIKGVNLLRIYIGRVELGLGLGVVVIKQEGMCERAVPTLRLQI